MNLEPDLRDTPWEGFRKAQGQTDQPSHTWGQRV